MSKTIPAWPIPRRLPRRLRAVIRHRAAAAGRLAAAQADAAHREAMATRALDLLAAGWRVDDVLEVLAT